MRAIPRLDAAIRSKVAISNAPGTREAVPPPKRWSDKASHINYSGKKSNMSE